MSHECPAHASIGDVVSRNQDKLSALKFKMLDFDLLRTIIGPIPGGGPRDAILILSVCLSFIVVYAAEC
eukprot:scaffold3927_cov152-Skeletonema_menzelii.AAC.13